MSAPTKRTGHKQILTKEFIYKIVLLEVVGFSLILPAQSSTGEIAFTGCNSPTSIVQCGTGNCLPSSSGAPPFTCTITVTFSPPFVTTPKYASATVIGCHTPECHFESGTTPQGSVVFQSDNGETWTNMPATKTEIYGNTNHESIFNVPRTSNSASFSVACLTGSASATAVLRPEYSLDGGNTWNELAMNTGALDVLVDSSNCSFSPSPAFSSGIVGIATAVVGVTTTFRVVGINGSGVGDIPVFNNIQLTFYGSFSNIWTTCIQQNIGPYVCPGNPGTVSKTKMFITVIRWSPATSDSGTPIAVNWFASE